VGSSALRWMSFIRTKARSIYLLWDKVFELIKKNGDIEGVLEVSVKEFEMSFYSYAMICVLR
jgi:hypothetical protein